MTTFTSWDESLCHHGIKGQKWDIRRFQNPDGSLTSEGELRYGPSDVPSTRSAGGMQRDINRLDQKWAKAKYKSDTYSKKAEKKLAKQVAKNAKNGISETKPSEKVLKIKEKAQKWLQRQNDIESMQWRILAKAAQSGYSTKVTPVTRRVMRGRDYAMNALAAASVSVQAQYLGFGLAPLSRGAKVKGNFYSIKKPKNN